MDTGDVVWSGFYHDGRTANREPVKISIVGDSLRVRKSDGKAVLWPVAALRQSQGAHSNDRLRLEFGEEPEESIVVEGPGLAEAITALVPDANPTLKGRRGALRLLAILGTITTVALGGYLMGAPVLARWLAPKVPVAWESELGSSVTTRMLRGETLCEAPAVVGGVRAVLDRLLATAPAAEFDFRLFIVQDTTINAFAAPGGTVVVNTGLLRAAATPDELAVVLAHEAQHVLQRHSMRAVIREVPLRLALAMISGDPGIGSAASIGGNLGALSYRRDDEREADVEGMRMLQAARMDAAAGATFMRTLEQRAGDVPRFAKYLSSHPRSAERAAELEALARQARYEPVPVLDAERWAAVQQGCSSRQP